MKQVVLKSKNIVLVGDKSPILVNCNVGINSPEELTNELEKIDNLFLEEESVPDIMMDLSICDVKSSIAKYIIDRYNIPVGVVPVYTVFKKGVISKKALLENIIQQAKDGVAFMTMHFTADVDIYEIAQKERKIPITSRGGACVISDSLLKGSTKNIYRECINEIIDIAHKYHFAISLGTCFRPAGIVDACDNSHILETNRQIELCKFFHSKGIDVIVENVGHISIDKIITHSELLKKMNAPIMPLGPIVIDSALGNDHIASSIGAAIMGFYGCAHIINAISPVEHLHSNFSTDDAKRAIIAAKIATKAVNVVNFDYYKEIEQQIYNKRAISKSCIVSDNNKCKRCENLCPLRNNI